MQASVTMCLQINITKNRERRILRVIKALGYASLFYNFTLVPVALWSFDEKCRAHATTDTKRRKTFFGISFLHLVY